MKKFRRIAYVMLIVIIVVLSLTIYTNASKDNGENQKDKVLSEIKYLEIKLENLFNSINNIKIGEYNIVEIETSKSANNNTNETGGQGGGKTGSQEQQGGQSNSASNSQNEGGNQPESSSSQASGEQSNGQSQGNGGTQSEQNNQSQGNGGAQGENSNNSSGQTQNQGATSKDNKKFEIEKNQILTSSNQEINWNSIKTEIENLYSDLPSITMDLYQTNSINQEEILNFSKECDNLTSVVKNEDKNETLQELTKVYDYLPGFLKNTQQDELYSTIINAKSNIFKAYSKVDQEKWDEISNDVKSAIDIYSSLLTNNNMEPQKQSNISKGYIVINELQNAVNLKDKSIFLIKYKNTLEEMNNM